MYIQCWLEEGSIWLIYMTRLTCSDIPAAMSVVTLLVTYLYTFCQLYTHICKEMIMFYLTLYSAC